MPFGIFRRDPDERSARERHAQLLERIVSGGAEGSAFVSELRAAEAASGMSPRKVRKLYEQAFRRAAATALDDELLTVEEEHQLMLIAQELGFSQQDLDGTFADVMKQLILARANDGRLAPAVETMFMAQRGEEVYAEFPGQTLKEQAVREFRGAGSGLSIPIGGGVRFRTGAGRGRMVTLGTQIVPADEGYLAVTSKRAVFVGRRKTIEHRYDKLVSLQTYTDAVALGVTNRQTTTLVRVDDGPYVAAFVAAAARQG
jgi:hypothetical protein